MAFNYGEGTILEIKKVTLKIKKLSVIAGQQFWFLIDESILIFNFSAYKHVLRPQEAKKTGF